MRTDDLPNWVPKGAVLQHHIFSRATPIGPSWPRPGPDLVPTSVQTQPNQPKWSRLPEKLKFQPCVIQGWSLNVPLPVVHSIPACMNCTASQPPTMISFCELKMRAMVARCV